MRQNQPLLERDGLAIAHWRRFQKQTVNGLQRGLSWSGFRRMTIPDLLTPGCPGVSRVSPHAPGPFIKTRLLKIGQEIEPININILGGTVSGTNRNRPWDKWDLSLGQTGTPSLGQTGLSLFNSTVKSPFCPVCPWDGWGFVPGTIVPQGPAEKCLCVFCLLVFCSPQKRRFPKGLGTQDLSQKKREPPPPGFEVYLLSQQSMPGSLGRGSKHQSLDAKSQM